MKLSVIGISEFAFSRFSSTVKYLIRSFFFITGYVYRLLLFTFIQFVFSTACKDLCHLRACNKPVWKIVLCGK